MKRVARGWIFSVFALTAMLATGQAQQADRSSLLQPPAEETPPVPVETPVFPTPSPRSREAAATLVVYNSVSPASLDLAGYYAEKRGIPFSHLIGLSCSMNEEISREEYDRTIAGPLRAILSDRDWWTPRAENDPNPLPVTRNQIRFVALMHGIPLKIAPVAEYPGDTRHGKPELAAQNGAAVDSELACLGYMSRQISGLLANPLYRRFTRILDAEGFSPLMLVTRLDGPTPAMVKRMIDDTLAAEKEGLWGFAYIDARGLKEGSLQEGDKWLMNAATQLQQSGFPVVLDHHDTLLPDDYPARDVAWYFGWYSDQVRGPFAREDFRFARGAIACHIHSFSATSIRNPAGQWVGPLISRGAVATTGNVYEPFLSLTPHLDVFVERLRNGFTFAEAAYMSTRAVSWMTTFVGDPLYRPFPPVEHDRTEAPAAAEWIAYRDGAKLWFRESPAVGANALTASGRALRSAGVFEGLGLLQLAANDMLVALTSFQQARQFAKNGDDVLRISIHETATLLSLSKRREALNFVRRQMRAFPKAHGVAILKSIELQLDPPPATPSPPATSR